MIGGFQVGAYQPAYQQGTEVTPVRPTGGSGGAKKPKKWWKVGDDLYYATEDQLPRLVIPDVPQPLLRPKRKPVVQEAKLVDVALPELPNEIVWPDFFIEVPTMDARALMFEIERRIREMEEDDLEVLLLSL